MICHPLKHKEGQSMGLATVSFVVQRKESTLQEEIAKGYPM